MGFQTEVYESAHQWIPELSRKQQFVTWPKKEMVAPFDEPIISPLPGILTRTSTGQMGWLHPSQPFEQFSSHGHPKLILKNDRGNCVILKGP